jgi:dihydroflavonol-4-reductase
MSQTLATLEKITGRPAPNKKRPYWLAARLAEVGEYLAFVTGNEPSTTLASVRLARHKRWFDAGKAIRELGLPQTPPESAFADAVAWFRANGYVKK